MEDELDLEGQKILIEQINREIRELSLKLTGTAFKVFDVSELKEAQATLKGLESQLEKTSGTASSFYSQLRGVTEEIKKQHTPLSLIRKSFRGLTDDASKLRYDEQGISELNTKQLVELQKRVKLNAKILSDETKRFKASAEGAKLERKVQLEMKQYQVELKKQQALKQQELDVAEGLLQQAKDQGLSQEQIAFYEKEAIRAQQEKNELNKKESELRKEVVFRLKGVSDESRAILLNDQEDVKLQQQLLVLVQKRVDLEKQIDKQVRIFDALKDVANFIPGLSQFAEPFNKASEAARKVAKENAAIDAAIQSAKDRQKENVEAVKKNRKELKEVNKELKDSTISEERRNELIAKRKDLLQDNKDLLKENKDLVKQTAEAEGNKKKVLWAGFKELTKVGLNMAAAFGVERMFTGLKKGSERIAMLSRELNISRDKAQQVNNEFVKVADSTGYSADELLKYQTTLSNTLGIVVDFNTENAKAFATMTERLGLSGDQASNLQIIAESTGKTIKEQNDALVGNVMAMSDAEGTAIRYQDVMKDIASASASTVIQANKFPGGIAKAAYEARKLGLNLQQVADVGKSLLSFESSIEAELEAELLTGKQLNLERARMAALTGDTATLAQELSKNFGSYEKFSRMGVLQQEALAKSMGMTADQAGQMLMKQEAMNQLSKDYKGLRLDGLSIDEQVEKLQKASLKEGKGELSRAQALAKLGEDELARQERNMSAQERMTKAMEALANAFSPLTVLFDGLAKGFDIIKENASIVAATLATIAGIKFTNLLTGGKLLEKWKSITGGIKGSKGPAGGGKAAAQGFGGILKSVGGIFKKGGLSNLGKTIKEAVAGKKGKGGKKGKLGVLSTITSLFGGKKSGTGQDSACACSAEMASASSGIEGAAETLTDVLPDKLDKNFKNNGKSFKNIFKGLSTRLSKWGTGIGKTFKNLGTTITNGVGKLGKSFSSGVSRLSKAFSQGGSKLIDGVKGFGTKTVDFTKSLGSTLKSGTAKLVDGLKTSTTKLVDGLKNAGTKAVNALSKGARTSIDALKSGTKSALEGIKGGIKSIGNFATKTADKVRQVAKGAPSKASNLMSKAKSATGKAVEGAKNFVGKVGSKGKDLIKGATKGGGLFGKLGSALKSGAGKALSFGKNVVGKAGNFLSKANPIKAAKDAIKGPIGKVLGKALGPILAAITSVMDISSIIGDAKAKKAAGEKIDYGIVGKNIVKAGAYPIANLALNLIPVAGTAMSILDGILGAFGYSPVKFLTDNLIDLFPDNLFKGLGELAIGKDKTAKAASTAPSPTPIEPKSQSKPQIAMAEGGIVTGPVNALVGEAGPEAVIPLREFYAKMDELISVVNKGGTVYLDGNRVGKALVMGTYKTD